MSPCIRSCLGDRPTSCACCVAKPCAYDKSVAHIRHYTIATNCPSVAGYPTSRNGVVPNVPDLDAALLLNMKKQLGQNSRKIVWQTVEGSSRLGHRLCDVRKSD